MKREVKQVGEAYRVVMLRKAKPEKVLSLIAQMHRCFKEIQQVEERVDRQLLRQVLSCNWVHVMGEDTQGRVVMWEQSCAIGKFLNASNGAREDKLHAWILCWFWIYLLTCRRRRSATSGMLFICDYRKANMLDRSLAEMQLFASQVRKLAPMPVPNCRLVVVASPAGKVFLRMFFNLFPLEFRQAVSVASSPKVVVSMLKDKLYYPSWFDADGCEVTLAAETHGNYEDLLERRGMAQLTAQEVFDPGRDSVDDLDGDGSESCQGVPRSTTDTKSADEYSLRPTRNLESTAHLIASEGWSAILKRGPKRSM